MKPAAFEYHRPSTVSEAVGLLAQRPGASRVLAGGQSLVLDMNYRRARPERLVDINRVAELGYLEVAPHGLCAGALVRHAVFEAGVDAGALGRLLSLVARHIGHPPIRNRGTMAGSLSYAHPAAEWPAVAVALDGELVLVCTAGERVVSARAFFEGPFATALRGDELLREIRLPLLGEEAGVGFVEHRRTHASFAVVAALAALEVEDGFVRSARIGIAGGADRPLRADDAELLLTGAPADTASFAAAGAAAASAARPLAEPHCSAGYRRHVVEVVVRRALEAAAGDAGAA